MGSAAFPSCNLGSGRTGGVPVSVISLTSFRGEALISSALQEVGGTPAAVPGRMLNFGLMGHALQHAVRQAPAGTGRMLRIGLIHCNMMQHGGLLLVPGAKAATIRREFCHPC